MSVRRLPVYILLDCSESMIGEAIGAVQRGVESLLRELRSDPHALETAYVSIITFHGAAQQVVPLTEVGMVQAPALAVRPGTSLGAALNVLRVCIEREVRKTSAEHKGDYRPIVFLLTDGQPTDDWQSVGEAISRLTQPRIANLYAVGCGDDVDFDVLRRVGDAVFRLGDMSPETIKKLFIWLTASVQGASRGAGTPGALEGIDLSKKPAEVEEVGPEAEYRLGGPPRQVFLKAVCTKARRPYLIRYRLDESLRGYFPAATHPLDSAEDAGHDFDLPSLNTSMLRGVPPCPFCGNPTIGVCQCDRLLCTPEKMPAQVDCPGCKATVTFTDGGGDITISQSAG
jgi:uncharacterized protein YegL